MKGKSKRQHKKEVIKALFSQPIIKELLVGKTVLVYGPGSDGSWGTNEKTLSFKISKVTFEYFDASAIIEYGTLDFEIYLAGYNANKHGLIYTDEKFIKCIQGLLEKLGKVEYTEQEMQGQTYVSVEIQF